MSARASWGIYCDCCEELMSGGDLGNETAREARDEARRLGGHRSRGQDICPECWDQGNRGATARGLPT